MAGEKEAGAYYKNDRETMNPPSLKNLKDIMYCTDVIHVIELKQ